MAIGARDSLPIPVSLRRYNIYSMVMVISAHARETDVDYNVVSMITAIIITSNTLSFLFYYFLFGISLDTYNSKKMLTIAKRADYREIVMVRHTNSPRVLSRSVMPGAYKGKERVTNRNIGV